MATNTTLAYTGFLFLLTGSIALLSTMIIMNTAIVVAVTRNKPLQDARNIFMCSLAISNIALVITNAARVGVRSLVSMDYVSETSKQYLCQGSSIALWWATYSYVGSLLLVTTEQFISVYKPIWHYTRLKTVHSKIPGCWILVIWVLVLLPAVGISVLSNQFGNAKEKEEGTDICLDMTEIKYALFTGTVLTMVAVLWYSYVHVYLIRVVRARLALIERKGRDAVTQSCDQNKLDNKSNNRSNHTKSGHNKSDHKVISLRQLQNEKQKKNLQKELTAIRRLSFLVITLMCTNLPNYLIPLINIYMGNADDAMLCSTICRVFQFLRTFKISVDPFIILLHNQKLKETVHGYFCRCCKWHTKKRRNRESRYAESQGVPIACTFAECAQPTEGNPAESVLS